MEDFRIEHRYSASRFSLESHYESVYQVLVVTHGRLRYRVGKKTYDVGRGDIIVLNTLEDHDLEVLEYPYERYLIRIQPDFFQNEVKYPEVIAVFIKRPPNFSHLLKVSEPVWNYLYDIVLEMEREYNSRKKYWELYVGSNLRRMFIIIYRECADMMSVKVGNSVTVAYNIMNYLDHHFTEDITIDQVAEKLFLSKNYMTHIFKEETGYSPMSYVIALRVNRAKILLSKTDKNITTVATECGYDDFAYFSRQFKKATGLTPSAYRKKYANGAEEDQPSALQERGSVKNEP